MAYCLYRQSRLRLSTARVKQRSPPYRWAALRAHYLFYAGLSHYDLSRAPIFMPYGGSFDTARSEFVPTADHDERTATTMAAATRRRSLIYFSHSCVRAVAVGGRRLSSSGHDGEVGIWHVFTAVANSKCAVVFRMAPQIARPIDGPTGGAGRLVNP